MYHVLNAGSNGDRARPDATRFNVLSEKEKVDPRRDLPSLWILASPHAGDNTQLMAVARALGWPAEVKRLAYRGHEGLVRLAGLASLSAVDRARSSPIEPPWPDVILSAGRPTEAVARWIRQHGNPAVRLVFVGTPWVQTDEFDLVIATPQYGVGEAPNVLNLPLPLHGVTEGLLRSEAQRWAQHLAHLPERRIAVLIGGSSGPYTFSPAAADRLGRAASDMARERGAALLVTTSARTPPAVTKAFEAAISVPAHIFHFDADAADNPFFAFLGLADEIVVTADSISMLAEACATEKPVWLFDIEDGPQSMRAEEGSGSLPPIGWKGKTLDTTMFRLLMRHAPPRWSRDLRIVHRAVVEQGLAQWLGGAAPARRASPPDSVALAAARIRGLFGLEASAT